MNNLLNTYNIINIFSGQVAGQAARLTLTKNIYRYQKTCCWLGVVLWWGNFSLLFAGSGKNFKKVPVKVKQNTYTRIYMV